MRTFAVEFDVMKGLGPEWNVLTLDVGLDDLDEQLSEEEIRDMALADALDQLRRRGVTRYSFRTIHDA